MAITTAGKLFVWGMGSQGCLGTGRIEDIAKPTELNLNDVVIDITSGAFHCIVLTEKNKMFGWGVNNRG
jgi:alpha-tubulin suppressor-like RCC1 family protein